MQCQGYTKKMERCKRTVARGAERCGIHQKAFLARDKSLEWQKLIKRTPLGYNPHGTFKKGDCEIKIYLLTNCGYFFSSQGGCGNSACRGCSGCAKIGTIPKGENDDHTYLSEYLQMFAINGYSFIGWPELEKKARKE